MRKYAYVEFPDSCDNQVKFSVTHDPAGAFDPKVKGLVLAAHTHCGQVRLPFYGALWIYLVQHLKKPPVGFIRTIKELSSQLLVLAQVYFQLELALNQIGIYCMLFSNNSFCI